MKTASLFARLKIGTRVYAGFALTLILVVTLGAVGVVSLKTIATSFSGYAQISDNMVRIAEIDAGNLNLRRNAYVYGTNGNEQAKATVRAIAARLHGQVEAVLPLLAGERKARLEEVGRQIDEYAAKFETAVTDTGEREKEYAVLVSAGGKATAAINQLIKTATADGDFEAATLAGQVQEALLLARLTAARFVDQHDRKLVDTFTQNYDAYRAANTRLLDRLKNPERKRLAGDAAALGADYARAFGLYATLTVNLEKLLFTDLAGIGVVIEGSLGDIVKSQRGALGDIKQAMTAKIGETSTTTITIAIGAFLIGLVVAFLIARSIVKPVSGLTDGMKELADGNFDVVLPGLERKDEVGEMAQAVEAFKIKAAEKARREAEERQAEETRKSDEQHLADQREAARQKAADEKAAAERKAAMHQLADQFEKAVGNIVETVTSAATELEAAASTLTQTADTTQQLSGMVAAASEEASANVQSVASATDEMSSSVHEISRQVQESSRIALDAVRQAQATDTRINALSQAASRIGDVVKLITAVAEQTNLLALNATIEAARAGEAGKGFAVVASEVKLLAAQTAKATDEISSQISGMQTETGAAVGAIKEIGTTIGHISEITATIASAVEEQGAATSEIARNVQEAAKGTTQVANNIADVNRGAGETGAASGQVLSSAQALSREGHRLKSEVDKFLATVRAA